MNTQSQLSEDFAAMGRRCASAIAECETCAKYNGGQMAGVFFLGILVAFVVSALIACFISEPAVEKKKKKVRIPNTTVRSAPVHGAAEVSCTHACRSTATDKKASIDNNVRFTPYKNQTPDESEATGKPKTCEFHAPNACPTLRPVSQSACTTSTPREDA